MRPLPKLLLTLAATAACALSAPAAVVFDLDDIVLDGGAGENTFIANTDGGGALAYSSGQLTHTLGSGSNFSYSAIKFTAQTLTNVGDSLSVTYAFTPVGGNSFRNLDGTMRLGLQNSGGTFVTGNVAGIADGTFTGDTGYQAIYKPFGGTIAASNALYQRNASGGTNSNLWDSGSRSSFGAPTLEAPGTGTVTGSFTLTLVSTGVEISSVLNGGTAQTVIDTTTPFTTFDYFSFFGIAGTTSPSITFTELTIDFTPVPESSPSLLVGVLGLIFMVQRRHRRGVH